MTFVYEHKALLALLVVALALALVSVLVLDQVLHLGLVQFLLHVPAWSFPSWTFPS